MKTPWLLPSIPFSMEALRSILLSYTTAFSVLLPFLPQLLKYRKDVTSYHSTTQQNLRLVALHFLRCYVEGWFGLHDYKSLGHFL